MYIVKLPIWYSCSVDKGTGKGQKSANALSSCEYEPKSGRRKASIESDRRTFPYLIP
jgi:hypothetical protein